MAHASSSTVRLLHSLIERRDKLTIAIEVLQLETGPARAAAAKTTVQTAMALALGNGHAPTNGHAPRGSTLEGIRRVLADGQPHTTGTIRAATGLKAGTISSKLWLLKKTKEVRKVKGGGWILASASAPGTTVDGRPRQRRPRGHARDRILRVLRLKPDRPMTMSRLAAGLELPDSSIMAGLRALLAAKAIRRTADGYVPRAPQ